MCTGERPIGAAKGHGLMPPPPPPLSLNVPLFKGCLSSISEGGICLRLRWCRAQGPPLV